MKKRIPICLLTLLTAVAFGCDNHKYNDIQDTVDKGVLALEVKDVKGAIKCTATDFLGYPGKLDRQTLTWKLKQQFDTLGGMAIHAPHPDIELDGDSAIVEAPFILTRPGVLLPELANVRDDSKAWTEIAASLSDIHRAELNMVKVNNTWLVQTIRIF